MAPPLAGEFRLRLNQLAPTLRWQVNLTLRDDQPPPVHPTGAHVDQLQRASNVQHFNFSGFLLHGSQTLRLLPGLPEGEAALTGAGVPPPAPAPAPKSVDWRVRWGGNWLCTIQNQASCENCWAFATVALIETMVRIEHNIWSKRSEGDLRNGWGRKCANGAVVTDALDWAKNNGVADSDCFAWSVADTAYTPTSDRSGRSTRQLDWQHVGSTSDQKTWLDQVGPLVACFDCFDDFFAYGSGVYRKTANANSVGGHCILIVGYDDGQGAWIVRNSWGPNWGTGGYCLFAYGECNIDFYAKQGIKGTNPDPWVKRRLHNGCVMMSGNGSLHKNFELVRATPGLPWIRHVWRDTDLSWHASPSIFSGSIIGGLQIAASNAARACIGQPCITSSTYNRNFEVVYREASGNLNSWFMDQITKKWSNIGRFGDGDVAGFPSLIQSSFGAPGNFEVIVMTKEKTLQHWWRGGAPEFKWGKGQKFASNVLMSGPSLIQASVGVPGNFYVLAVMATGNLQMWWRNNNDLTTPWIAGEIFNSGTIGATPPVMVQASFFAKNESEQGNFEAFVQIGGRVQHWWRDNSALRTENPVSNGNSRWHPGFAFGHDVKHVWGAMQGDSGTNMEVFVERVDGRLQQYYRGHEQWFEGAIIDV